MVICVGTKVPNVMPSSITSFAFLHTVASTMPAGVA